MILGISLSLTTHVVWSFKSVIHRAHPQCQWDTIRPFEGKGNHKHMTERVLKITWHNQLLSKVCLKYSMSTITKEIIAKV